MMNWLFNCNQCSELCTKTDKVKNRLAVIEDFYHRQIDDLFKQIESIKIRLNVLDTVEFFNERLEKVENTVKHSKIKQKQQ